MENTSGDRGESRRSKREVSVAGSYDLGEKTIDEEGDRSFMDDEGDGPVIGGRPKHAKGPNPLNDPTRERKAKLQRERNVQANVEQVEEELDQAEDEAQEIQPQSRIPSFGDGSEIISDWTTLGLFDDVIDQYEDTCGSVVFTRLLQASYNKDRPIAEHRNLSYKDLAFHMKGKTVKDHFGFRNINIPIKYIRDIGLHKDDKISGPGVKTKGDFVKEEKATVEFIYEKLEQTPLGIIIQSDPNFEEVIMEIYTVQIRAKKGGEHDGEHALLVVGKGRTRNGVDFLVVQNSWGPFFGNHGYGRICLPDNGRFKIFWPIAE